LSEGHVSLDRQPARWARPRAPSSGNYRHRVSIDPGWPVATAVVLLLALTLAMYVVGDLPGPGSTAFAAARAILQLGLAALVITSVIGSLPLSVALLCVMFAIAVVTTVRRVGAGHAWPWATVAMLAGLVPVLAIILLTRTVPPTGIALIPVVGILAGNTMNGHTLTCRRAFSALRDERGQYEAGLSLGLTRAQAVVEVVHRHVPEALIPGLDQVRTAGVVTLPGAFIGVLLGGGTPAQAAAAQVLVLLGIMAAQTTTAVVAERLIAAGRLLPDDLATSLPR
jgi:putative ABC transport system permease protein